MVVLVVGYAHLQGMTLGYILPLLLTILLASIPVALPATFTLAAALGSVELSSRGVLITRLSALHDIASMTVLCSDKTGTLTRNEATVNTLWPAPGFSENDLLRAAALASDPAGQDPVDGAIVQAATARGWQDGELTRIDFKPFDPATKRAEAVYREATGARRYVKGAPAVVAKLCGAPESAWQPQAEAIGRARPAGARCGAGGDGAMRFAGLLGLEDAVREDSSAVVARSATPACASSWSPATTRSRRAAWRSRWAFPPHVCPPEKLHGDLGGDALDCGVFAGVFPEDKFRLVRAFQRRGEVVGMSGDGVNDAPGVAPGRGRHRRGQRDRRGQGRRRHGADPPGTGRRGAGHRNQPARLPAHDHLHAQHAHQEDRDDGPAGRSASW